MRKTLLGAARQSLFVVLLLLPAPLLMGAAAPNQSLSSAVADLNHAPTGRADVTWNAQSHTLKVVIAMSGLAPKSTHPAHIHTGSCATANAPVKYMLYPVVADASGNGGSTTIIYGVTGGISTSGWSINVHNGPGLTKSSYAPHNQYLPIACANLVNPFSTHYNQAIRATLRFTQDASQGAQGTTELWIANNTLYVRMTAVNLQPGSDHMAHIHTGSCASQGGVAYALVDLRANGQGIATSTTTIHGVHAIPSHGWYINVHLGTGNELSTQTGFDPILCGNIVAA